MNCPIHMEAKSKEIFIAIVIIAYCLLAGCDLLCQVFYKSTVDEYNEKLGKVQVLQKDHNDLVVKIRETALAGQNEKALSLERQYIDSLKTWRETFEDFRIFIETNYNKIRKIGVNPDYIRDNVKTILNTMRENEVRYRMDQMLHSDPRK